MNNNLNDLQQNTEAVLPCCIEDVGGPSWLSLAVCSITHRSVGTRGSPKHVPFMVNNKRNQSGEKRRDCQNWAFIQTAG